MKNGWQTQRLGDVATLQRGFDLPTHDRVGGEFPLVSSSGISDTHHKSAVRGPGVVTGRSGSIGNVFFIEDDFWPLNTVLYVKDFHGNDPRFVFRLLEKFDLKRFATGSGVPTLNRNFVHDELVNVPPLSEQHRIVRILDEAFDGIVTAKANAEKNLQNARALFESYLQSVFTQRGDGWAEKPLEQIGTTQTGSTPKSSDKANYGDFIPFVKPSDFSRDGSLNYANDGLSAKGLKQARQIAAGSILMVCIGATIGKCGYCEHTITTNQQINALTPFDGVSYKFVYFQMLTKDFHRRVLSSSGQATLPIINKSKWNALTVALPPTLEEQKRIAVKLDILREETQRLESVYQHKLAALDALKKSLLHQAFTGQL
jgi:type I restriction enzyme, S subunit